MWSLDNYLVLLCYYKFSGNILGGGESFLFFLYQLGMISLECSGDINFIPLLFQPFSIPEVSGKHATNRNSFTVIIPPI